MKKNGKRLQERRKHLRKLCFFEEVDYSINSGVYTDPVQDISANGVFIETNESLNVGNDVTMLFSDYSNIDLIKVTGDVVRKMPWGVAIKFKKQDRKVLNSINTYINRI